MAGNPCVASVVQERRAVRAFSDRPVPREEVRRLLQLAGHAPSNSNTQPWLVHVLAGEARAELSRAVLA